MSLNRRSFLGTTMAFTASLSSLKASAQETAADLPNIVLFIGDDVGPQEFGCYGHPTIRTPNIDAMAENGIRFTNAFVTTSSCSPSRASFFTGKYPHSTGAENLHDPLPADQTIITERLKPLGYHSGTVGKCHLGPEGRKKFDAFHGKLENWKTFLQERPKQNPFFLSVGFHDAHRPFDRGCVSPPYEHDEIIVPPYLPDIPEVREDLAGFYDEITRMDAVIGEVIEYLHEEGTLENTILIFFGDNGMPFPRAKTTMYDSGIHTPLVVQWPERIHGGKVCRELVSLVDIVPTLLDLFGIEKPEEIEGISFAPQLKDPYTKGQEYIFAEKNWHDLDDHSRAVRDHRFKYIRNAFPMKPLENSADSTNTEMFKRIREMRDAGTLTKEQMLMFRARRAEEELYDLVYDPNEFRNLAYDPAYQEVLQRMRKELDDWIKRTDDIPPSNSLPDEFHPETGERIRPPHQNQ